MKNQGGKWLTAAIGILLAAVVLSTMWLLRSSQTTTEEAVYGVSKLYLEELTTQQSHQLAEVLGGCVQQLRTIVCALEEADVQDMASLQAFTGRMQEASGFPYLAFRTQDGSLCTRDSVRTDARFHFLEKELNGPVLAIQPLEESGNLLLIGLPVEGWEDYGLSAAVMGIQTDTIANRLSISDSAGNSFSNVVLSDGRYVIRTPHTHLSPSSNVFDALAQDGEFTGDGLALWQEDLAAGRSGMAVYRLKGLLHYTYYMPVSGTDWFIMTTLHYNLISANVDVIRTTLTRNSLVQLLLALIALTVLFAVYLAMYQHAERLRFEKLQAEESSKAKSVFLSNMSHDIRTPMNAITGFANLAVKNVENPEKTRDYLAKILTSSSHLLALINDVLEMSRIESGKIHLEESACNLPELLHELNSIILGQVQSRQQHLLIDASDVTDEDVWCDKLRLNQVFLNLLGNAVKFTPAGGKIAVRIQQAPEAPEGCGTYIIRVKDNGIGMSEEFSRKIFTAFEREQTAAVSGIQGTGLGMAITKNIIDLMGGTIQVESAPGQGTEFTITLTLRLCGTTREPVRMERLEGVRALVADGDCESCAAAVRMLAKLGLEPEWTTSGREAVLRAEQAASRGEAFGVCIVDWHLPDLDGAETVRQLRAAAGEAPSILLAAACDGPHAEPEAQAAGVDGFCCKPLFLSDLRTALSRAIGQQTGLPEEPGAGSPEAFTGRRLLLAEDNELNREIAIEILTEAGFQVETAVNGAEAVERVQHAGAGHFDLVLMDIQMPVMNGYAATKAIRALADPALAGIPIIAMTANAFEEDKKAALDAGMNGHISKPLDIQALLNTLHEILVSA